MLCRSVDKVGRGWDEARGGDDHLPDADQLGAIEANAVVANQRTEEHDAKVVGNVNDG